MDEDSSHISADRAISNIKNLVNNFNGDYRSVTADNDADFYTFYSATNENLEYLSMLGIDGKDTLTVTGSGDQALNLAFFGASSIETFDINQLTFFALDLKMAALMHLSRSEFISFYSMPNLFDKKLYQKLRPYISEITRVVFDTLLDSIDLAYNYYDCVEEPFYSGINITCNNPYLSSEQAYLETRKRMQSLKRPIVNRQCPVNKLDKVFGPKDVVLLSNILQYCLENDYKNQDYNFDSEAKKRDFVRSLANVLKQDGIVSLLYIYNPTYYDKMIEEGLKIKTQCLPVLDKVHKNEMHRVILAKKRDFPQFEK